jgi:hypothetical protein
LLVCFVPLALVPVTMCFFVVIQHLDVHCVVGGPVATGSKSRSFVGSVGRCLICVAYPGAIVSAVSYSRHCVTSNVATQTARLRIARCCFRQWKAFGAAKLWSTGNDS